MMARKGAMNVLSFGEILWDVIEGEYWIGGAPLNFAGHQARLGAWTAMVSAVGRDELGDRALAFLERLGVEDRWVNRVAQPTGTVMVELREGIPSYDIREGSAWDAAFLTGEQAEEIAGQEWDLLYIGSLAQRTEGNRRLLGELLARGNFRQVFYDVNLRQDYYSREVLESSFRACTIAKLNDEEVEEISRLLTGEVLGPEGCAGMIRREYDVDVVCVTLGKEGAWFFSDGEPVRLTPGDVDVADTVGAGDSFSAGLVYGYLTTGDVARAGQLALDIADFVVTQSGALPEYSAELRRRIAELT